MSAEAFVDTNVFVCHVDGSDARKQRIAAPLVRDALARGSACTSSQVAQEWLNALLHKAKQPMPGDLARAYFDQVLWPLVRVTPSAALVHRAPDLRERWQFAFHDALIVAAALQANCRRLLTEDLQHGQRIETLTIENPFA